MSHADDSPVVNVTEMPLIPESVIDEIQVRADIADVVGRCVPLKRAGRHFKALCPFHKEKTPSFVVNTDKQIFHCFGCGVGGNVFSFLMQHDRLTFPEVVRLLADQVGVRIPEQAGASHDGAHEQLAALMEQAGQYFERRLLSPQQGKAARAYLERRGVSERTRRAFRLGLSPPGWDQLLAASQTRGVSSAQLESAGLVIRGKSGYYDRFRSRLMFPITDVRGRVLGFGGRSLDSQEPKYLNSPETALYTKGRHLFGLTQAKEAIMAAKTALVVEGYFDCVVLAGFGLAHVVSPLGTALTADQVRLLKRYAECVILAFDADAAGEQATLRGIDLLVETGVQVRVAQLPRGMDPDDYVRSYGREQCEQWLERSISLFDCLIQAALQRYPMGTTEGKVQAAQFVLPTIAKISDAMLRSEYVRRLANCLQLDEGAVAEELAKAKPRSGLASTGTVSQHRATRLLAPGPERLLTALVLEDGSRWARMAEVLPLEAVADPTLRRILAVVGELESGRSTGSPAQVISRLSEEGYGALVSELVALAETVTVKNAAFDDCLRRLQINCQKVQLAALREQIRTAQEAGREAEVHQLLTEYHAIAVGLASDRTAAGGLSSQGSAAAAHT